MTTASTKLLPTTSPSSMLRRKSTMEHRVQRTRKATGKVDHVEALAD